MTGLQSGTAGFGRAAQGIHPGLRRIHDGLRHELPGQQILIAFETGFGILQIGTIAGQLRLRLGDSGGIAAIIERKQQIAGADILTFFHMDGTHHVLDLRTHIHGIDGGDIAVGRYRHRYGLHHGDSGFDGLRSSGFFLAGSALAHCLPHQQAGHDQSGHDKRTPDRYTHSGIDE